jgi:hypothetical protein
MPMRGRQLTSLCREIRTSAVVTPHRPSASASKRTLKTGYDIGQAIESSRRSRLSCGQARPRARRRNRQLRPAAVFNWIVTSTN